MGIAGGKGGAADGPTAGATMLTGGGDETASGDAGLIAGASAGAAIGAGAGAGAGAAAGAVPGVTAMAAGGVKTVSRTPGAQPVQARIAVWRHQAYAPVLMRARVFRLYE